MLKPPHQVQNSMTSLDPSVLNVFQTPTLRTSANVGSLEGTEKQVSESQSNFIGTGTHERLFPHLQQQNIRFTPGNQVLTGSVASSAFQKETDLSPEIHRNMPKQGVQQINSNIVTFNTQSIEERYRERKELNYKHIKTKLSPFHRKLREARSVESRESESKPAQKKRNDYIYPT